METQRPNQALSLVVFTNVLYLREMEEFQFYGIYIWYHCFSEEDPQNLEKKQGQWYTVKAALNDW